MKFLTILIFVAMSFFKDGKTTYYESGKIKSVTKHSSIHDCDSVTEYFRDGGVWMQYQTRDGKYTGLLLNYYPNGNLYMGRYYVDGKRNGFAFNRYQNGASEEQGLYNNDIKTGLWKYFNIRDSTVYKEMLYEAAAAPVAVYDNDATGSKQSGNATVKYYYQNKPTFTGIYKNWIKVDEKVIDQDLQNKYIAALPEGKTVYNSKCTSCHFLDKEFIGPALAGVGNRHSEEWLIKMIRNEDILLKAGDKDAIAVKNKSQIAHGHYFLELDDYEIKNIIGYLKNKN